MSDELQYKYILIQRVVSACLSVNWREVLRAEFTVRYYGAGPRTALPRTVKPYDAISYVF